MALNNGPTSNLRRNFIVRARRNVNLILLFRDMSDGIVSIQLSRHFSFFIWKFGPSRRLGYDPVYIGDLDRTCVTSKIPVHLSTLRPAIQNPRYVGMVLFIFGKL